MRWYVGGERGGMSWGDRLRGGAVGRGRSWEVGKVVGGVKVFGTAGREDA